MIIKQNRKSGSILWQEGLIAALFATAAIGLFCLTCKPQALALTRVSDQLNMREPAAATAQARILSPINFVPKLSQKMTILLLGVDSNGLNTDPFLGTRSDTMMLVSIDPLVNKVSVISIPRDSRVIIPNRGIDKINSAHAFGGVELSMQTVREAFGIPVDHYIEVDTAGLKKLFEILGPVEVLVEKEMHYIDHSAKLNVDLQPGLQQLSPEQAEEYLRFRHDGRGDIGRIERQQWFVRQAARKFKEPQIVLKLPQLIHLGYQCVRTDLPVQDLLSIANYAKDFPQEKVLTAMLPGDSRFIHGGSYWVPDSTAGQLMFSRILGSQALGMKSPDTPLVQGIVLSEDKPIAKESEQSCGYIKPATVAIKYPSGAEQLSLAIAAKLNQAGFKIKGRWQVAKSDCQHELLMQQSPKANDEATNKIYESIPEMRNFPLSLAIETHPSTDFTIVVSSTSQMPSISQSQPAVTTVESKVPLTMNVTNFTRISQE